MAWSVRHHECDDPRAKFPSATNRPNAQQKPSTCARGRRVRRRRSPSVQTTFVASPLKFHPARRHAVESRQRGPDLAESGFKFEVRGTPVQLLPVTRHTPLVALEPMSVGVDPSLAFGRPVRATTDETTAVMQDHFHAADPPSDTAEHDRIDAPDTCEATRFDRRLAAAMPTNSPRLREAMTAAQSNTGTTPSFNVPRACT